MSEEKQKDTERNAKVLDVLENEITHQRIGVLKQLVENLWGQIRTTSDPLAHAVALSAEVAELAKVIHEDCYARALKLSEKHVDGEDER